MKRKERPVPDERVQRAWTALSARFFFLLLAVLAGLAAMMWTQTGRWISALPEMIALAVGVLTAVFALTSGKAWRGKDEAVSERRNISLHMAYYLMNWTAYFSIFIGYFADHGHHGWYLLSLAAVAAVYFARRILAAKCGLILYKTEEARRRGDHRFRRGSVILAILTAAFTLILLALVGLLNWLTAVIAAAGGTLIGWAYLRYYRWLMRMSETAANAEVSAAEEANEE